jgi:signal transduction histidine kinase
MDPGGSTFLRPPGRLDLLTDAVKYTPSSGRIWIKATVEGKEAVVRIVDNGEGIPPHMLSDIFQLFVQVMPSTTADAGVGIGLSLVKDLVTLHGGTVQANSDGVGKGSEFTVRLPAEPDSQQ